MKIGFLVPILSLQLASCTPQTSGGTSHKPSKDVADERVVSTTTTETGGQSLAVGASSTETQVAYLEGELSGVSLSFPPGALSIDTQITVEPSASREAEATALIGSEALPASKGLTISSSADMPLAGSLILSIPVTESLSLLDPTELAVFFHVTRNSEFVKGVLKGAEIELKNGLVVFKTKDFGFFQVIRIPTTSKPVETVKVETPPTPKVDPTPTPSPTPTPTPPPAPNKVVSISPTSGVKVGSTVSCSVTGFSEAPTLYFETKEGSNPYTTYNSSVSSLTIPQALAKKTVRCRAGSGSSAVYSQAVTVENTAPVVFSYTCPNAYFNRNGTIGSVICTAPSATDADGDSISVVTRSGTTCPTPLVGSTINSGSFSFTGTGSVPSDCVIKWNATDGSSFAFAADQTISVLERNVSSINYATSTLTTLSSQCRLETPFTLFNRGFMSVPGEAVSGTLGASTVSYGATMQTTAAGTITTLFSPSVTPGAKSLTYTADQQDGSEFVSTYGYGLSTVDVSVRRGVITSLSTSSDIPAEGKQVKQDSTLASCSVCTGSVGQLSVGHQYATYIGSDGVYTWGEALAKGRLGGSTSITGKIGLQKIAGTTGAEKGVTAGSLVTCVLKSDSKPACLGDNTYGTFGSQASSLDPVGALTTDTFAYIDAAIFSGDFVQVVSDKNNTLAVTVTGNVIGAGAVLNNLLGDSSLSVDEAEGKKVKTGSSVFLLGVRQVSLGEKLALALSYDSGQSRAYSWGKNDVGQLGLGSVSTPNTAPQQYANEITILAGLNPIQVAAGSNHGCVLVAAGNAFCFGLGTSGQLGNNAFTSTSYPTPVLKSDGSTLTGIVAIAAGGESSYFIVKENGSTVLYSAGKNNYGQLGIGSLTNVNAATLAVMNNGALSGVLAVDAGSRNACIIKQGTTNKIMCVGEDNGVVMGPSSTYPGTNVTSFYDAFSISIDKTKACNTVSID